MKKSIIATIAIALLGNISVQAQELTAEQQGELLTIGIQYAQTASLYEGMIQGKMVELALELTREGRLDSEESAKVSAKRANAILKDVAGLYGEFVQVRVAFMLEAKNALTDEQKLHLLASLEPGKLIDIQGLEVLQPEIFDLPISLNREQRKKLIKLEADLLVKEIKLERDVKLAVLELEEIFLSTEEIDPDKVDKQVMKLAEIASDAIDTRVAFVLEAKDVLTLDQKRLLSYLMGL